MASEPVENVEVKETDIVFGCPHCTKSLAIDYRGAGLFIICPDCNNRIQVPIPEGMELSDLDSTVEEQTARIIHLRELLQASQDRIRQLEREVADLEGRRKDLEALRVENLRRIGDISEDLGRIEQATARISTILKRATDASAGKGD
jgi:hypothetical protein